MSALPALPPPLPRVFFDRPTVEVARDLLGKLLVRRLMGEGTPLVARITEVEAYLGLEDAASHARRGPTPRAAIMFGPAGRLYVYLIYGVHHCMNIVTEADGIAGAVLIRAASLQGKGGPVEPALLRGPGKLCAGLGITLLDKGLDLTAPGAGLFVADDGMKVRRIGASPRVGVAYAGAWARRNLRFYVPGDPSVSGPKPRRASRATPPSDAGRPARRDLALDRGEHRRKRE